MASLRNLFNAARSGMSPQLAALLHELVLDGVYQTLRDQLLADRSSPAAWTPLLSDVITVEAGRALQIAASVGVLLTDVVNPCEFRITIDGLELRATAVGPPAAASNESVAFALGQGVIAGTHTVNLEWRQPAGPGGSLIRPVTFPDFEHASMTIQEVTL